jgi:L-threonylcarbamoyladenylate synthase
VKTLLTRSPERAAEFIKRGGIVAFPTETVYGLGADVFNESAVARIFEAKDRPVDNPLIAHVHDRGDISKVASDISTTARKLIFAFFPGPLTIVLSKAESVPLIATAGLETIGVRIPGRAIAQQFLDECGVPVVAPSANLSGRPSPTTWEAVYEDLNGRIDCILQDDATQIGIESTVVDCTSDPPVLLRKGAVSIERLREVVPDVQNLTSETSDAAVRSPGLRHKHYSPRAKVVIVHPTDSICPGWPDGYIGLSDPKTELRALRVCGSVDEYAHSLFEFFRDCYRAAVDTIYCEAVPEDGIGAALMDRLRRAAEA